MSKKENQNALLTKTGEHLANLILNRNDDMASYALFLGAGASQNSGIRTAEQMIDEWRRQLYARQKTRMRYDNWLDKQSWYKSDQEYGILFKELYDEPSQRRDYIEKCMEGAHPSWGYVYLASLLQAQIFNTVFTTNFDDLSNECCYLYSDKVRPIVCAHDSEVANVRITKKRAKIIKLHGDFLFEDIKNTPSETSRLEKNMELKLSQFGQEYGLVVIGYGGRDNSVMSILEQLLANSDYFKHGVYWCIKRGETPRERVQKLLTKDRVHVIEINGFDEFMALVHNRANLQLPPLLVNPMAVAEQRSKVFCSVPDSLREDETIRRDIARVLDSLAIPKISVHRKGTKERVPLEELPNQVKAAILRDQGDLNGSLEYMRLAIVEDKKNPICAYEYAHALASLDKKQDLKEFIKNSAVTDDNISYFMLFTDDDNALVDFASKKLQIDPGNIYVRINRAIAYKRLKNTDAMNKDLKKLEELQPDDVVVCGIAALKKNREEMFKLLDIALNKKLIILDNIQRFPVFEDYRMDAEFKKFIEERRKGTKKES